MEASEATVDMASEQEPKVQQATTHGEELDLALANISVEGAFMCLHVNETHQSFAVVNNGQGNGAREEIASLLKWKPADMIQCGLSLLYVYISCLFRSSARKRLFLQYKATSFIFNPVMRLTSQFYSTGRQSV